MQRYSRKPAVVVVLVSTVLAAGYLVAAGPIERYLKGHGHGGSIEAMEKTIAEGKADGKMWFAYGDALADAGRHSGAADAFREALAQNTGSADAKFRLGVSLAQAGRGDELFGWLKELVSGDAKVAVRLFEHPAVQRYAGEERFAALSKEATGQAMD
ncbi:MAG TPA: tetratricopeptide repeat protein [Tepidisphaeraceae bacterium]|nr:tetratricopeptide repeat protein [Tepidisphaeraceae bacterium]